MSITENRLLSALFDYELPDDKILNFKSGDMFIVLKPGDDYTYVVSAYGRLGYVPTNYAEQTTVGCKSIFVYLGFCFCFDLNLDSMRLSRCHSLGRTLPATRCNSLELFRSNSHI